MGTSICSCTNNADKSEPKEETNLTLNKQEDIPIDDKQPNSQASKGSLAYTFRNQKTNNSISLKSRAQIHRITQKIQIGKIIRVIKAYIRLKKQIGIEQNGFNVTGALIGITIESELRYTTLYDRNNYFGIRKWTNGSWYSGTFHNGQCHGIGIYHNHFGDKLIGMFIMNKISYYCIYQHSKGGVYEGEWLNNVIHGIGKEEWADNSSYKGIYVAGSKEGIGIYIAYNNTLGTYIWNNGSKYQGYWKANLPHGNGIFYYHDGRRYEGEWYQGKMHGIGVFTWPDGKKYIGSYEQERLSGFGMFIWTKPKNKIYLGFWSKSKQNGFAKIITRKQERFSYWKEGKKLSDYLSIESFYCDLSTTYPQYLNIFKLNFEQLLAFSSF